MNKLISKKLYLFFILIITLPTISYSDRINVTGYGGIPHTVSHRKIDRTGIISYAYSIGYEFAIADNFGLEANFKNSYARYRAHNIFAEYFKDIEYLGFNGGAVVHYNLHANHELYIKTALGFASIEGCDVSSNGSSRALDRQSSLVINIGVGTSYDLGSDWFADIGYNFEKFSGVYGFPLINHTISLGFSYKF